MPADPTHRAPDALRLREPARRVSPRARAMWAVTSLVEDLLLLAGLLVVTEVFGWFTLRWWMWALFGVVLVVGVVVLPVVRYRVHRWEVTEDAVYTQTGWWAVERRIAPMSRVQTVDYAEGAISRVFGLADVTVTTASASGALVIAGLARADALRLVDDLTTAAAATEGDAT